MANNWQLTIDANDPARMVEFWAPLLGYEKLPAPDGHDTWNDWYLSVGVPDDELDLTGDGSDRIHDPSGGGPSIWFQIVPEAKTPLKNRLHLDIHIGGGRDVPLAERIKTVDAMVNEIEARGGSVLQRPENAEETNHYYFLMVDPEGNEFCLG